MKSTSRLNSSGVLYYGEVFGVLVAWVVGVAVVFSANSSEAPSDEPERLANAAVEVLAE